MTKEEMDAEANYFAMCLLMPAPLLLADVDALGGLDACDDPNVRVLAKKYGVTEQMMTLRIYEVLRKRALKVPAKG